MSKLDAPTKIRALASKIFEDREAELPETPLDLSHLEPGQRRNTAGVVSSADLTGLAKVLMAIGAGGTGKTTLLRWICERSLGRDESDPVLLASVDPLNRDLGHYFPETMAPKTSDPAQIAVWLEKLLGRLMASQRSAAIDFGGGDSSLASLVAQVPDLHVMMEQSGVVPVALYLLSPRVSDLMPMLAMEKAGFQPRATAVILNCGRADPTRDTETEFAQIRQHSAYRAVIGRGAAEIWMPRLFAAKAVEDRRISFKQACEGGGEAVPALGMFDRSRVVHWLEAMDQAFGPHASWLA
jgi:hypothetical protein